MVLVPAGDSGNHFEQGPYVVGNMNLLGMVKNEALMAVPSANEEQRLSALSSEWNELYRPFIAANGTGEWNADHRLRRDLFSKIRLPAGGLQYKLENLNPIGTPYACADLAHVLFDQANLAEGAQLQDPAAYVQRLNKLLLELSH